jgi:hypothetical protein
VNTPPNEYQFSKRYKFFMKAVTYSCALFTVALFLSLAFSPVRVTVETIISVVVVSICLLFPTVYMISILPKLKDSISLSETGITHYLHNGNSVRIGWHEIEKIKNSYGMGRLELIAKNPDRKIQIEHQINQFQTLVQEIERHLEEVPSHEEKLTLKTILPIFFENQLENEQPDQEN